MKKKPVLTVMFILILSVSVYSFNLETFTSQIDTTYEVQSALFNVKQIHNEISSLTHPEDVNFSLNPSVKALTREGGIFGEEIEISGSASVKIPLGLSSLERERLNFAINALDLAEAAVDKAREKTYIKIHSLYQKLWLLQEEERILMLEVSAAEGALEILSQRFALGNAALINLSSADETLQERNDDFLQNQLEQRISWFELKSLTSLDEDVERLEKMEISLEELPKPPELYIWVTENNPEILFEKIKLLQMEQTLKRLRHPDFDISVKSFFNSVGNTFTANLNYDFKDPELTPSITFPLHTFGVIPSSGGSADTWNLGLTFNLSLGTNRSDNLSGEILETEIQIGRAKLDFLIESTNLELRSAYQQHMRDLDALEQMKRALTRSANNHKIIETKKELGQVSAYEILESESIVERSIWKIEAARINAEKSWLNLLENALWFKKVDNL